MPTMPIRCLALAAACCATLVVGASPSLARSRHRAAGRAAPTSHAAIPQNANIENLNDLSLQRARAGKNTASPLAPPLAQ